MLDLDALRDRYRAVVGSEPEGLWFAPGRVNLIGEHTDYNDGFVLPFALDKKAVIAGGRRDDDELVMVSLELDDEVRLGIEDLSPGTEGWSSYLAGVVWALREAGHAVGGANLVMSSDVPLGAGLSSSAAIECATVAVLADLYGLDIEPIDRAKLARVAENAYVGAPTGLLDQAASTLCEAEHGLFLDCRTLETEQVPLPMAEQGYEMLVLDTKTPHSHVDGEYGTRRASCEQAAAILGIPALRDVTDLDEAIKKLEDPTMVKRVRHVVTENERVLKAFEVARSADLAELAPLLDASHASMRDDYEITVPTVDLAVDTAKRAGALGARMTGGGFGGCIIALTKAGEADRIGQAIATAFADAGFGAPEWFTATPAAGAGRLV
ncbi:galactokinase [Tessaracoccus sp. ZS01]|uniref:galactokinase n=1 Tax=Tessaracoccus sp. ZS01 TaxID=1906324 RepID=UPI00096D964D|nr:galactokinase [Tessaracoccus sp. ZS01]MCG6566301.1 galactokinase [Tessaracoccus sp. ZS01]OMG58775.1 galactokinase [Tessaracoccus sp. ZS01]